MTILLADKETVRVGGRIEGAQGYAAACGACPLKAICRNRAQGALAVVTKVREGAPWKDCALVGGKVRAVEATVYAAAPARPTAPTRCLRVVLDNCALDHPAIRAALGASGHEFYVPHEVAKEALAAPWRGEVHWAALRVVRAPVRHPHIRAARPACKEDAPSDADRAVMQAAFDLRAHVLVSADRHVTEAGLEGVARAAGQALRVQRPEEFVRRHLPAFAARAA